MSRDERPKPNRRIPANPCRNMFHGHICFYPKSHTESCKCICGLYFAVPHKFEVKREVDGQAVCWCSHDETHAVHQGTEPA